MYVIHFWGFRDGSRTDTSMVVRLKYPGKTNKENTHGHAWSVYVNPVGHDAAVKNAVHRCSASGYRSRSILVRMGSQNALETDPRP